MNLWSREERSDCPTEASLEQVERVALSHPRVVVLGDLALSINCECGLDGLRMGLLLALALLHIPISFRSLP